MLDKIYDIRIKLSSVQNDQKKDSNRRRNLIEILTYATK